jgi:hypothetical protein
LQHDAIDFAEMRGTRIAFDVVETRFKGSGVELAGRLIRPQRTGKVPIVVLGHGAERHSARDFYALQRLFPSEAGRKVADLCRTYGITERTYYRWNAKYGEQALLPCDVCSHSTPLPPSPCPHIGVATRSRRAIAQGESGVQRKSAARISVKRFTLEVLAASM